MVKAMQKAGPAWAQLLTIDIFLWAILGIKSAILGEQTNPPVLPALKKGQPSVVHVKSRNNTFPEGLSKFTP